MVKRVVAASLWLRDCMWMIPLVGGMAAIILLIGDFIGPEWAAGYILLLILFLCFNAGAHRKGDGEPPTTV